MVSFSFVLGHGSYIDRSFCRPFPGGELTLEGIVLLHYHTAHRRDHGLADTRRKKRATEIVSAMLPKIHTSPLSTANLTRLPERFFSNSSRLMSLFRSSVASNCGS